MSARATLSDVARAAGVSSQTVSRVLNDSPLVHPTTRAKVMRAVESVGYEPNLAARALAAGGSRAVGILLTSRLTHGMSATFTSLVVALREHGRPFVLDTADETDPDSVRRAMSRLRGYRVRATILLAQQLGAVSIAAGQHHAGKMVAVIAGNLDDSDIPTVGIDQALGARLATEHLLSQGCRNLLHIPGDLAWQDASERLSSYVSTCEDAGVEPRWMCAGSWNCSAGAEIGAKLLGSGLPEAILAGNDDLAIGLSHTLLAHGVRIPEDVALVGFDDIPQARWMTPSLTTVVQDFSQLGRAAVTSVETLISGDEPRPYHLTPTLAIRDSSRRRG